MWLAIAAVAIALAIGVRIAGRKKTQATFRGDRSATNIPPQVLRLKGTTEAVQSRAILAPLLAGQQVPTLTIIRLAPGGARVQQGDVLVEFDRQAQMRDFIDKQAEYAKLVDQVAEEQAKENAAAAKDETELKTAEDNLRKTELEIQKAEIVSRIDAEKNQQNLDEAKATFAQLRETFDLKRKAAQAAIRILEIQRDRTQQTMLHAQANADLMQIHSPLDGVVVLDTIWKQGTMGEVQEGDQVRPGVTFMQVVNPATMQVRVMANQQDFPSLRAGQTAKVRLDAYPDLVFAAKLDQLAPIGEAGDFSNKLRSFVVVVAIDGNDPRLMPDLSAAVDVDVDVTKQSVGTKVGPSATGSSSDGSNSKKSPAQNPRSGS
jgi:multidrug efflux pump subunit AcrA (membrane-fusion protein)